MNSRESTGVWKSHNLTIDNLDCKCKPPNNPVAKVTGHSESRKSYFWQWSCLILLLIVIGNMFFTSVLLCRFSQTKHETLLSLNTLSIKMDAQESKATQEITMMKTLYNLATEMSIRLKLKAGGASVEEFQRLELSTPSSVCRCPTCVPTDPIPTNKDPVSLVNQVFGIHASYNVTTVCLKPAIHIALLTIDGKGVNKTWKGRGEKKQRAKHEAAYNALLELREDLAKEADFLPEDYSPKCISR